MQDETLGLDRLRPLVHARRDMHLEARLARGARHRQAVEQERKILVGEIEQSSR